MPYQLFDIDINLINGLSINKFSLCSFVNFNDEI